MGLSKAAIQKILGIKNEVFLTEDEMSENLSVVFFPYVKSQSSPVLRYQKQLEDSLKRIKVNVIAFSDALTDTENGKKLKKGIVVLVAGECDHSNLPIKYLINRGSNLVINIIEIPKGVTDPSSFDQHFDILFKLSVKFMSPITICVDDDDWVIYSSNGSHHEFKIAVGFDEDVLKGLVPLMASPIFLPRLKEFEVIKDTDNDATHDVLFCEDILAGGRLFPYDKLYPKRVNIKKNYFKMFLFRAFLKRKKMNRPKMSYGYLARQLPLKTEKLIHIDEAKKIFGKLIDDGKDYFESEEKLYLIIEIDNTKYVLKMPEIWILVARSGSKRAKLNFRTDILKVGLVNGKFKLVLPANIKDARDYMPPFDTKLILSLVAAHSIYSMVVSDLKKETTFSKILKENGMGIAHWHGYILPEFIPKGWKMSGNDNPHVSCSSAQALLYAFLSTEKTLVENFYNGCDYLGNIHIEPYHGINITWPTLEGLGHFLLSNKNMSKLGNEYFHYYQK